MESVTELYPGEPYAIRVWVTQGGRKEMDARVHTETSALFEDRSERGYYGSWLRDEGNGVYAFGTRGAHSRIAGYFPDHERKTFVVCGAWKGKNGRGGRRPPQGDAVVERTAKIKGEGVIFVQTPPTTARSR